MPIFEQESPLFPSDTTRVPQPGSKDYALLLEEQLQVSDERFIDRLRELSPMVDVIFDEFARATKSIYDSIHAPRPIRVLDLAGGIGFGVRRISESGLPIEALTIVDWSDEILSRAQEYIPQSKNWRAPIREVPLDLIHEDLPSDFEGKFDAVLISIGLFHYPTHRQRAIVHQAYKALSPNGFLVFQSHFRPLWPHWKTAVANHMVRQAAAAGKPENELRDLEEHVREYHNLRSIVEAFNWLEEAGFSSIDCAFRKAFFAILCAVKTSKG